MLIVLGGRIFSTDNYFTQSPVQTEFLNQICVLRVDTLDWYEVKFKNTRDYIDSFPDLFDYTDCLVEDTILIFGGMSGASPRPYTLQKNLFSLKLSNIRKSVTEHQKTKSSHSLFSKKS